MTSPTLWPAPDEVVVDRMIADEQSLTLIVHTHKARAMCPDCGQPSERVHSRYQRTISDLPWHGVTIQLRLQTRRFFCLNSACRRRIFTERLPALVRPYARRTLPLQETLRLIGLALGGRAGSRLAQELGLMLQRDTVLRLVRTQPSLITPTPRVLGVDDWAQCKGQRYGTILVDLERHRRVDLLPDRSAQTLAQWLGEHPGVQIISRDRASAYAEGAATGAPAAIQVADRWHLLKNLREALERLLNRHHAILKQAAQTVTDELHGQQLLATPTPSPSADDHSGSESEETEKLTRHEQRKRHCRERRLARYEEVVSLYKQGAAIRTIARTLSLERKTVRRWVRADIFPERRSPRRQPGALDPFKPYLHERWESGCHNAAQLWREIQEQGYTGCESMVRHYLGEQRAHLPPHLRRLRSTHGPRSPAIIVGVQTPSARQASWLLLYPEKLLAQAQKRRDVQREAEQRALRRQLCVLCPEIETAQKLGCGFIELLRERKPDSLDGWLREAMGSAVVELSAFARGLQRDKAAVRHALALPWSNGQVEGQVNRLKLVKRQMYGRANFDLLRLRVLAST